MQLELKDEKGVMGATELPLEKLKEELGLGNSSSEIAAHIHDGDGVVAVSPENLLKAEVELANKRVGKIEGQPATIRGQASAKGYRYLEYVGLSVREKE